MNGFATGLEDSSEPLKKTGYMTQEQGERLMKMTGVEGGAGLARGTQVRHRVSKRVGRTMQDVDQPLRNSIPVSWDGGGLELLPMSDLELL